MLNIKTGNSVNPNAAAAGKEAAAKVKENLSDMKMAFVYSGVQYDQKELLDSIISSALSMDCTPFSSVIDLTS